MELWREPWPWYVAGPLIGLLVPLLLMLGGKPFGISANLRHMCAATVPAGLPFFKYDWKRDGGWNLLFALGILLGGFVAARWLMPDGYTVAIADATRADLLALGLHDLSGVVPPELFSWESLSTGRGWITLVAGGFSRRLRRPLGRRLYVGTRDLRPGGAAIALAPRRPWFLRRRPADDPPAAAAHSLIE